MTLKTVRSRRKQTRLRSPSQQPKGRITGLDDNCRLPIVRIYTDGSCNVDSGAGGWGAILVDGDQTKEISGCALNTTNNQMELTAAIEALRFLRCPCNVLLFSDSRYVVQGMTQWVSAWIRRGWRKADGKPVLNVDL